MSYFSQNKNKSIDLDQIHLSNSWTFDLNIGLNKINLNTSVHIVQGSMLVWSPTSFSNDSILSVNSNPSADYYLLNDTLTQLSAVRFAVQIWGTTYLKTITIQRSQIFPIAGNFVIKFSAGSLAIGKTVKINVTDGRLAVLSSK